jgi:excisionase family DNA binding protein
VVVKPLLDYEGAATLLGVKISTLRNMVSRGQVPHIRLAARIVKFDPAELERWVDKCRQPAEVAS